MERLTAILVEGTNDFLVAKEARVIAESHLEMQRIRVVQHGAFHEIIGAQPINDLKSQVSDIAKIDRYARRAVSRRKTALTLPKPGWNRMSAAQMRREGNPRTLSRW